MGWYESKFFNKETVREDDSKLGFIGEVFTPLFIHRNHDDLEIMIDFLIQEDNAWDFFKPAQERWKYAGAKTHNLVVRQHYDPLVTRVHSTMSYANHEITAEVMQDLHFKVNASAFDFFIAQIKEAHQKGARYSPLRVEPSFTLIVPAEIILALREYPWDLHKEKMEHWANLRQEARENLARDPRFIIKP